MPPDPLKIKDNSYLTDAPLLIMPTNTETLSAKTATLSIQDTCCEGSCYVAAAATCMPAGLVSLPQTPLLFKHTLWFSAAARLVLAG